jgi:hypothetical protein
MLEGLSLIEKCMGKVEPGIYCLPRHPTPRELSFLELHGIP